MRTGVRVLPEQRSRSQATACTCTGNLNGAIESSSVLTHEDHCAITDNDSLAESSKPLQMPALDV
jgi:hypothetical protein